MARDQVQMNPQGEAAILNLPAVKADIERRGAAVKAAAGNSAVVTVDMTSGSRGGIVRPRVRISFPNAMNIVHARRHEAKHGTLARALAAGGG